MEVGDDSDPVLEGDCCVNCVDVLLVTGFIVVVIVVVGETQDDNLEDDNDEDDGKPREGG